jgi:hypothetical protein
MYIFVIIELPKKATYHLVHQPKNSIVTMYVFNLQTDNHIQNFENSRIYEFIEKQKSLHVILHIVVLFV